MANAHYNKIPEFVSANAPLRLHDDKLWNTVRQFYEEIRNPIFHGSQLTGVKAEPLRSTFGMFDEVFKWIDTWTAPNRLHKIVSSSPFRPMGSA